jgi:hypothetical protein
MGFDPRVSEWGNPLAVVGWHRLVRGERREVKHLSTYRRRYSGSSGERNRMRLNRGRVIPQEGCGCGVVG